MAAIQRLSTAIAVAAMALAFAVPVHAQGKSNGRGTRTRARRRAAVLCPPDDRASGRRIPIAWLDDASLLAPGATSLTFSIMRWAGTDLSEVHFPVIDASVGITPRLQIGERAAHHRERGRDGTSGRHGHVVHQCQDRGADRRIRIKLAVSR